MLFAKCDPKLATKQTGFDFLILNFKTDMTAYKKLAEELNILGLL